MTSEPNELSDGELTAASAGQPLTTNLSGSTGSSAGYSRTRSAISDLPGGNDRSLGRVSRYELVREIGRGGYGIVFLAIDSKLNRDVAVKIARPEVVADPVGIRQFQKESQAAATLQHPGIVPVFDCGVENEFHFYVMPFFNCDDLGQWLAKQTSPIDQRVAAEIIRDLAVAIHYGHQQGIIHRDIKPQNILLNTNPTKPGKVQPIVLDFGLCGVIESGNESTSLLAGTPRYMSPEQAMFGSCPVTKRSDLYSIGVVFYQLLTGVTPHQANSLPEAIMMLHGEAIELPRTLRPDLSLEIQTICLKCLRKDPDRRYPTAQRLVDDLESYLNGTKIQARPERIWERVDFAVRFGEWEVRLGWAAIVLNIATIVWAAVGATALGIRFGSDPEIADGLGQLAIFIAFVALPIHCLGAYAGWIMIRKTSFYRRLAFTTLACGIWSVASWHNFFSDRLPLRIYDNQGFTQIMVFLMIASVFSLQTLIFGLGMWAAKRRSMAAR